MGLLLAHAEDFGICPMLCLSSGENKKSFHAVVGLFRPIFGFISFIFFFLQKFKTNFEEEEKNKVLYKMYIN